MMRMRKGTIMQLATAVLAIVITLAVAIIVFGYFQKTASDVITSLNNTEASNAFNTATSITWNAFTLLAVGILAMIGFGIIYIFRR